MKEIIFLLLSIFSYSLFAGTIDNIPEDRTSCMFVYHQNIGANSTISCSEDSKYFIKLDDLEDFEYSQIILKITNIMRAKGYSVKTCWSAGNVTRCLFLNDKIQLGN